MKDIGDETVFDAGSVFLEGENDAGEADAGEIKERHFERNKGIFERNDNKNESKNGGVGVFA